MLGNIFLKEAVNETNCFVRIDSSEDAGLSKYFLFEKVELVCVGCIFTAVSQTRLQHKVSLDDPGKAIAHLNRYKRGN